MGVDIFAFFDQLVSGFKPMWNLQQVLGLQIQNGGFGAMAHKGKI